MKRLSIFILIAILAFSGCDKKKSVKPREAVPVPVTVTKAKRGYIAESSVFVGTVKAQDEAEVFPRASGKVKEKLKQEGDFAKKDETIMLIDRDEVGYEYAPSPVAAPLEGYIGNIYVDKGDSVAKETPVANVVNIDKVKIRTDIADRFLSLVKVKQPASVKADAYPDMEFKGEISMVSPSVDVATRTFPIEVTLANEERLLKPGMFARIELVLKDAKDAIIIPREGVIRVLDKTHVYAADGNAARKEDVQLGIQRLDVVEVISGLEEGEEVIIKGQYKVKDGIVVDIVEREGE